MKFCTVPIKHKRLSENAFLFADISIMALLFQVTRLATFGNFLVQFSSVQFSSVQFSSVQFSSVQFSSVQLFDQFDKYNNTFTIKMYKTSRKKENKLKII